MFFALLKVLGFLLLGGSLFFVSSGLFNAVTSAKSRVAAVAVGNALALLVLSLILLQFFVITGEFLWEVGAVAIALTIASTILQPLGAIVTGLASREEVTRTQVIGKYYAATRTGGLTAIGVGLVTFIIFATSWFFALWVGLRAPDELSAIAFFVISLPMLASTVVMQLFQTVALMTRYVDQRLRLSVLLPGFFQAVYGSVIAAMPLFILMEREAESAYVDPVAILLIPMLTFLFASILFLTIGGVRSKSEVDSLTNARQRAVQRIKAAISFTSENAQQREIHEALREMSIHSRDIFDSASIFYVFYLYALIIQRSGLRADSPEFLELMQDIFIYFDVPQFAIEMAFAEGLEVQREQWVDLIVRYGDILPNWDFVARHIEDSFDLTWFALVLPQELPDELAKRERVKPGKLSEDGRVSLLGLRYGTFSTAITSFSIYVVNLYTADTVRDTISAAVRAVI